MSSSPQRRDVAVLDASDGFLSPVYADRRRSTSPTQSPATTPLKVRGKNITSPSSWKKSEQVEHRGRPSFDPNQSQDISLASTDSYSGPETPKADISFESVNIITSTPAPTRSFNGLSLRRAKFNVTREKEKSLDTTPSNSTLRDAREAKPAPQKSLKRISKLLRPRLDMGVFDSGTNPDTLSTTPSTQNDSMLITPSTEGCDRERSSSPSSDSPSPSPSSPDITLTLSPEMKAATQRPASTPASTGPIPFPSSAIPTPGASRLLPADSSSQKIQFKPRVRVPTHRARVNSALENNAPFPASAGMPLSTVPNQRGSSMRPEVGDDLIADFELDFELHDDEWAENGRSVVQTPPKKWKPLKWRWKKDKQDDGERVGGKEVRELAKEVERFEERALEREERQRRRMSAATLDKSRPTTPLPRSNNPRPIPIRPLSGTGSMLTVQPTTSTPRASMASRRRSRGPSVDLLDEAHALDAESSKRLTEEMMRNAIWGSSQSIGRSARRSVDSSGILNAAMNDDGQIQRRRGGSVDFLSAERFATERSSISFTPSSLPTRPTLPSAFKELSSMYTSDSEQLPTTNVQQPRRRAKLRKSNSRLEPRTEYDFEPSVSRTPSAWGLNRKRSSLSPSPSPLPSPFTTPGSAAFTPGSLPNQSCFGNGDGIPSGLRSARTSTNPSSIGRVSYETLRSGVKSVFGSRRGGSEHTSRGPLPDFGVEAERPEPQTGDNHQQIDTIESRGIVHRVGKKISAVFVGRS